MATKTIRLDGGTESKDDGHHLASACRDSQLYENGECTRLSEEGLLKCWPETGHLSLREPARLSGYAPRKRPESGPGEVPGPRMWKSYGKGCAAMQHAHGWALSMGICGYGLAWWARLGGFAAAQRLDATTDPMASRRRVPHVRYLSCSIVTRSAKLTHRDQGNRGAWHGDTKALSATLIEERYRLSYIYSRSKKLDAHLDSLMRPMLLEYSVYRRNFREDAGRIPVQALDPCLDWLTNELQDHVKRCGSSCRRPHWYGFSIGLGRREKLSY